MLQAQYVRNLNCNYERILLEKKPEENRYQYCIVTRGGIKRLLPCSLRYINGQAYLYYDISSTQSIMQLYSGRSVGREWVRDLLWSMKQVQRELERFLLDDGNLIWHPEHIFQDLEKKDFSFLYIPYYEGDDGFQALLDYLVERIDYDDDKLVECVYLMHEQFEEIGKPYLQERIFEDARRLDEAPDVEAWEKPAQSVGNRAAGSAGSRAAGESREEARIRKGSAERKQGPVMAEALGDKESGSEEGPDMDPGLLSEEKSKKGIRYFFENRKKKLKEEREALENRNRELTAGYAVAEDSLYSSYSPMAAEESEEEEEELGRTMYFEEKAKEQHVYRLYDQDGRSVCALERDSMLIGKKKGETDCVLTDGSVSRLHARITKEEDEFYLEDLNSTNGTFKNGLRLQPYEKRKLMEEDEIRFGKVMLTFR